MNKIRKENGEITDIPGTTSAFNKLFIGLCCILLKISLATLFHQEKF